MIDKKKVMEAAEFLCNHMGDQVYIVDTVICDECPDMGKESCILSKPGKHSIKATGNCCMRHVMVRPVTVTCVDFSVSLVNDDVMAVINQCYYRAPSEIFTTQEAAVKHMESLPGDIKKFYPSA